MSQKIPNWNQVLLLNWVAWVYLNQILKITRDLFETFWAMELRNKLRQLRDTLRGSPRLSPMCFLCAMHHHRHQLHQLQVPQQLHRVIRPAQWPLRFRPWVLVPLCLQHRLHVQMPEQPQHRHRHHRHRNSADEFLLLSHLVHQ